ncbi:diacylglycerol kinase [Tenacibaculum phage pT24]|uniref:dihydrofolate reductase n=1 Tax=Tenacibaculum phage pT24 TaxID=1880590 RepID=A0A1B4XX05_9CAUD|nr:dihydrofolate reductase [Tenacibaculum phage pT24]BAV39334.1 diacylglycerol kinase [Tenacibaculum phage pT24]
MATFKAIVATARNNIIGNGEKMGWNIPEELEYFKQVTQGSIIIMGRKTFESIGCRLLPNRKTIVITRENGYKNRLLSEGRISKNDYDNLLLVTSYRDVIIRVSLFNTQTDVFVVGGGEIYKMFEYLYDEIYVSRIDMDIEGDVTFDIDLKHYSMDIVREPIMKNGKELVKFERYRL